MSGHRLIALIEIVSPSNKDQRDHIEEFATKVTTALSLGVHVLLIDLFPPGLYDPQGLHGAVWALLDALDQPYDLPANLSLTLASYDAGPPVEAYLDHLAVGFPLPEMPLFLQVDRYINVPLEPTYQSAFQGSPMFWREILERP